MFQITSDSGDSGPNHEIKLRVNGQTYYPTERGQCTYDPVGFCSFRAGQSHRIHGDWVWINRIDNLFLDVEEQDDTSENDSTTISLSPKEWLIPGCESYKLKAAAEYEESHQHSVCYSVGVSAEYKGFGADAGIETCDKWTTAAENYVWEIEVWKPEGAKDGWSQ